MQIYVIGGETPTGGPTPVEEAFYHYTERSVTNFTALKYPNDSDFESLPLVDTCAAVISEEDKTVLVTSGRNVETGTLEEECRILDLDKK